MSIYMHDYAMVVEDELFQQSFLEAVIRNTYGCQVLCCDDGQFAIEAATARAPLFVVCDLKMPKMDGIEFLTRLSLVNKHVPVIVLSSLDEALLSTVEELAFISGMTSVRSLSKPIDKSTLEDTLAQLFDSGSIKTNRKLIDTNFSKAELLTALEQFDFVPLYQPQIDSIAKRIKGFEALVRWNHSKHGLLNPNQFLPLIFKHELSYKLFLHILRSATKFGNEVHASYGHISLSVNVTAEDMSSPSFVDDVLLCLEENKFPPQLLILEVTETHVADDMLSLLKAAGRLRIQGIQIAIDDFGTGHSSISNLVSGPFTELKLDKSFIEKMLYSKKHFTVVKGLIALADSLELRVIAEGVESEGQLKRLLQLGCTNIQGYYYSKPLSSEAALTFIKEFG